MRVVHVVHDHRADDARRRPGGQQPPVNGANKLRAEDIGEIGRDGGEPAAIHRGDEAEGGREYAEHAERRQGRGRCIAEEAEREEGEIGDLPPDLVRQRRPEEAPGDVEQREQPDKRRADQRRLCLLRVVELTKAHRRIAEQPAAEGLLQHRRGHADNADARAHVEAEHPPDQPELRGLVRILERDITGGDHGVGV